MELHALAMAVLLWMTGLHTGYSIPNVPPTFVLASKAEICRLFLRKETEGMTDSDLRRCAVSRVAAVYVEFDKKDPDTHDTVYIPDDFDPRDVFAQAQVAHETGHYVQRVNGVFDLLREGKITVGAIEGEGHQFQKMWFHTQNNSEAQARIFAGIPEASRQTARVVP